MERPQFSTRGLLAITAAIAVVITVLEALGPIPAFVLTLAFLAVFAHVAGNVIGTKLRDGANQSKQQDRTRGPQQAERHHFAPATQLSHKRRIGRSTLIVSSVLAGLAGAVGGVLLARINWQLATVANLTLAVVSCSVLGGLWGFWLCSFTKVALHAWREALLQESRDQISSTPSLDRLLRSDRTSE